MSRHDQIEKEEAMEIEIIGGEPRELGVLTMFQCEVTPEEARELLRRNLGNRVMFDATVNDYARDLRTGSWMLNGDAIRLSRDGVLLDGQHRLAACVKANVPLATHVATGLDGEVWSTIDRGRKRTIADNFAHRGIPNARACAATAASLATLVLDGKDSRLTMAEADEILRLHPHIVEIGNSYRTRLLRTSAPLAALEVIAVGDGDGECAAAWRNVWTKGIPRYEDCPAHLFRERLIKLSNTNQMLQGRQLNQLLVKAFLLFSAREVTKTLKVGPNEQVRLKGWSAARIGLARGKS